MKKISKLAPVLTICLIFLLSSFAFAGEMAVMSTPNNKVVAKTICLDGYKFVVIAHGGNSQAGRGVAVAQVFSHNTGVRHPQPIQCR